MSHKELFNSPHKNHISFLLHNCKAYVNSEATSRLAAVSLRS